MSEEEKMKMREMLQFTAIICPAICDFMFKFKPTMKEDIDEMYMKLKLNEIRNLTAILVNINNISYILSFECITKHDREKNAVVDRYKFHQRRGIILDGIEKNIIAIMHNATIKWQELQQKFPKLFNDVFGKETKLLYEPNDEKIESKFYIKCVDMNNVPITQSHMFSAVFEKLDIRGR